MSEANKIIHLNSAGAAIMPAPVLSAIHQYLDLEQQLGGYAAQEKTLTQSEAFYSSAAQLIHCDPSEIAFMPNATHAWDMIFYAIPWQAGDKILTCMAEYTSNYIAYLQMAKRQQIEIQIIPNDEHGQISIEHLEKAIDSTVKLISITHVPTNNGLINPVKAVGAVARQANIPFLLDATQSVGQMPVDVQSIGCDFLCATGRKYLRGPRGTGFLYVNKEYINQYTPPFLDLWSAQLINRDEYQIREDARRFETSECNIANKIGLTEAINYLLGQGIDKVWQQIKTLSQQLREKLNALPQFEVQDTGKNQCGIVTFTHKTINPERIKNYLCEHHIDVSVTRKAHSYLDMQARNFDSMVRASVHYYNTEQEIDRCYKCLKELRI